MAIVEVEKTKNSGSGFNYTFKSEGLNAHADFDPLTGVAEVKFEQATNMAAALETVVSKLQSEARIWKTNPILPLRIDIDAGRFANSLRQVAPRFGFSKQQPAGEFGTEDQHVRFRAELPLAR
jgi:hypothetical protein